MIYAAYTPAIIGDTGRQTGTGWLPPMPDFRDYTETDKNIPAMAEKLRIPVAGAAPALPPKTDLRQWCSPIEDQANLGSCTAQAAAGVIEYFERRAFNRHIDASRLFIYKTTRNLMGVTGDTGAWLRFTMGALRLCGAPPEKYWPYTEQKPPAPDGAKTFDDEPSAFVYAMAENYEALVFFCHDPLGKNVASPHVLTSVKKYLAAGVPSMFGFFGFPSANEGDVSGAFPFPCPGEKAIWGHAVVAVGYDDKLKIANKQCKKATTGAFLIRNSWGTSWGDKGYGWLPYDYVTHHLAVDFWSLLRMEWVDTNQFGL